MAKRFFQRDTEYWMVVKQFPEIVGKSSVLIDDRFNIILEPRSLQGSKLY